jgi:hypothetical protein
MSVQMPFLKERLSQEVQEIATGHFGENQEDSFFALDGWKKNQ